MPRPASKVTAFSREFLIYLVCGGVAVSTDFLVYVILLKLTGGYRLAYFTGYATGTILSFVLNRSITFRVHDAATTRLLIFIAVAAVGYLTSYLALYLMIEFGGLGPISAKILSLVVVIATQFSLNKFITFSKRIGAA